MKTKANISHHEPTNEELIEHNFTHHLSDEERQFLGVIDHNSPSQILIQKESSQNHIREDAEACARKLNFFRIAQKASESLHRANANTALRIYSSIKFHVDGEKVEDIGERIGKCKQTVSRYSERFVEWTVEHCENDLNTFSAEFVINLCKDKSTPNTPFSVILDEFRDQLTFLFFDLVEAAEHLGKQNDEVYLDIARFQNPTNQTIDVAELLATI